MLAPGLCAGYPDCSGWVEDRRAAEAGIKRAEALSAARDEVVRAAMALKGLAEFRAAVAALARLEAK